MSLEFNKIAGALLTAGVVAMTTGFVADLLVSPESLEENAYPIAVSDAPSAGPAAAEEPGLEPVLPLLADADLAAGEAAFRACAACHTADQGGANRVGPNLWNIVGASHAHRDDFNYSDAMQQLSGEPWTYEALNAFIADPRGTIPGTRMAYGGMRNVQDRANLIAWLRSQSDDPHPLPTEEEILAVAGEAEPPAAAEEADEPAAALEEEAAETAEAPDTSETAQAAPAASAPASAGGSELVAAIAAADTAEGQAVFRRCAACHTYEEGGPNRVGPNLWNVVGGPVAHLDNFNYSDAAKAMAAEGTTWTYENLAAFLENPRGFMPGTRMVFPGLRSLEERAAVIAFLREQSNEPAPLAAEEAASEREEAEAGASEAAAAEETPAAEATEQAGAEAAPAAGGSELLAAIGAADPADGEGLSRRCAACHTFNEGGPNRVGPNLWNVVGGPVAHLEGFNYSDAAKKMAADGVTWTYENLDAFLENPRGFMPGTRMVFPGLRSLEDRAAMIAYLRSMSEDPPPLE